MVFSPYEPAYLPYNESKESPARTVCCRTLEYRWLEWLDPCVHRLTNLVYTAQGKTERERERSKELLSKLPLVHSFALY